MGKVALTYSSAEELEQRMSDLEKLQDTNVTAIEGILKSDQVSKRGMGRVLSILTSYPRIPHKKITNDHEAALLKLSLEVKEIQLIRLMIATELGNRKTQEENSSNETKEQ